MKKSVVVGLALVLSLALAAVAIAENVYSISASTKPTKAGTPKNPVPVALKFGFTTVDDAGRRPASLQALSVKFNGMKFNSNNFKGCSASRIEQDKSAKNCPKGSLVATGYAKNRAGGVNDRNQQALRCYLKVSLYNSRNSKGALFIENGQSTDNTREDYCPALGIATAIPVTLTKNATGDTLRFKIPVSLQNPAPGIKNSLVETQLNVPLKTTKVKGEKVGFMESLGGCRKGKRNIQATFTHEDGVTRQTKQAKCSK